MNHMELGKLDLKSFFFIGFLIILGLTMLQILSPFVNVFIIALIIVQMFHPIYDTLFHYVQNKSIASIFSTLITLFLVILPLIIVAILMVSEVTRLLPSTPDGTLELGPGLQSVQTSIDGLVDGLNTQLYKLSGSQQTTLVAPDLSEIAEQVLVGIQSSIGPFVNDIVQFSISILFTAFILIVTLLYLFPIYQDFPRFISRISPLDDKLDTLLVKEFTTTTRAVLLGSFLVAIAQATAVLIALLLLNIGAPVLLWVIMVILSLIPVGSGLVWFPVGIVLIFSGQPVAGIVLIAYSAVIINVIDTALRPYVMKGAVNLHPLIIIFSALGGIGVFGPLGILYGPVLAVFFASLMDVYTRDYAGGKLHHQQSASEK